MVEAEARYENDLWHLEASFLKNLFKEVHI